MNFTMLGYDERGNVTGSANAGTAREAIAVRGGMTMVPEQSDRDALMAMLDRAGIVYRDSPIQDEGRFTVLIIADRGPNQDGYTDFYTDVSFDEKTGALVGWGTWEGVYDR